MIRIKRLICTTLIGLLLAGCTKDALMSGLAAGEGEETTIAMRFKVPGMTQLSRAGLKPEEETKIVSLCIYIFDHNTGALISNTIHENAGAHASDKPDENTDGVISPEAENWISIETLSGDHRDIYVIANYHTYSIEDLKGVYTIDQAKQIVAKIQGNPLTRNYGMVMTGIVEDASIRKRGDITVPLKFMSAKVTVKVVNNCPDLVIDGWSVDGFPTKSYVFERPLDDEDPNYHDAPDITDKSDFYYDFTDQTFPFEETNGNIQSATFYTVENRRRGRVQRDAPPATTPERSDYQLKAWYAPNNATRLIIRGTLTKDGKATVLDISHYLGANNTNNYDVFRATHYIYTVTINSLNEIDIDTNIAQQEATMEVTPSADLMSMDAHTSYRPFIIRTDEIKEEGVEVSVEVLEAVNSSAAPDWLNLALFPTVTHQVRDVASTDPTQIGYWQQDGDRYTYVRPKYIPNKAAREKLASGYMGKDLIGTEGYPTEDKELTYDQATHRLCKKITAIPTGQRAVNVYLYADEYEYDTAPTADSYREAVVRFTMKRGNDAPKYKHFTVRQYPPYRFAKITEGGTDYMLVVERVEEYEHFLQAQLPMELQMSTGMQWGPYTALDAAATSFNDGVLNTLKGVYKNGIYTDGYLSPKYGSASSGWDKGEIKEGAPITLQPGSLYNLPIATSTNAYNIIYNTTAARYCHEKNRDINGDGVIDDSETHWYLPSEKEMQLFWTFHEAIDLHPDYYWSSTAASEAEAYAVSMQNSPAAPHRTYNGVPVAVSKTTALGQNFPRVRCVKRIPIATTKPTPIPVSPIVSHRADGTTVVDCSNLPNNMYTTDTKMDVAWSDVGSLQQANLKVFRKFEIQRAKNDPVDYNTLHKGNGKCDTSKGWRLPTQREMLMVYTVKDQLEANSAFSKFTAENYWTMTSDLSAQYVINFSNGICVYGNFFGNNNKLQYRCVREVQ